MVENEMENGIPDAKLEGWEEKLDGEIGWRKSIRNQLAVQMVCWVLRTDKVGLLYALINERNNHGHRPIMSLITTMLESVAEIQRPTIGQSGGGVTLDPWKTIKSNIPCSVEQAGPAVVELYAQRNVSVSTTIYFALTDPGVQVNDRLSIVDRTGVTRLYLARGEAQPSGRGRIWTVAADYIGAPS